MRMADQIVAAASEPDTPARADYLRLAHALTRALCFELTDAAAQLASVVGIGPNAVRTFASRPSYVPPAEAVYLEWLGPSGRFNPHVRPNKPDERTPDRCGALIEFHDGMPAGTMHFLFRVGEFISVLPIATLFDWRELPEEVPCLFRAIYGLAGMDWSANARQVLGKIQGDGRLKSITLDDAVEEERRWGRMPSRIMAEIWARLNAVGDAKPEVGHSYLEKVLRDWEGEVPFIQGVLLSLASGALQAGPVQDVTRANKRRVEQGRPPLFAFATLTVAGPAIPLGAPELSPGAYVA
jgi:hypothetical protein